MSGGNCGSRRSGDGAVKRAANVLRALSTSKSSVSEQNTSDKSPDNSFFLLHRRCRSVPAYIPVPFPRPSLSVVNVVGNVERKLQELIACAKQA